MSLFADLFSDQAEPLLFEQLGEQVTYYPAAGGEATPYTAIVAVQRTNRRDLGDVSGRDDVLHVSFSRTTGAGPDSPQRGDRIWRSENGDPSDKLYAFHGNEAPSRGSLRVMEFVRVELQRVGMLR